MILGFSEVTYNLGTRMPSIFVWSKKHEYDFDRCISNRNGRFQQADDFSGKVRSGLGKENAKAARAGGVSLMALSLAACGSSDDTTDTTADTTTDTTTTTLVAPTAQSLSFTANLDDLKGGAGDDKLQWVYYADGGTGTTAFPGDIATGGEGTDTLTISVAGLSTTAQSINAIKTSGIENIFVTNYDTNGDDTEDTTLDASLMEGYTTIGVQGSNSTDTIFFKREDYCGCRDAQWCWRFDRNYLAATVVGTADSENLTVSNVTAGTFTSNGIETITVNSELAKSTVTAIASDAMTKLVVTGDQNLTISTAVDFVDGTNNDTTNDSTIDASAFTGKLNVTAEAMDQTITGGSGDDTIIWWQPLIRQILSTVVLVKIR